MFVVSELLNSLTQLSINASNRYCPVYGSLLSHHRHVQTTCHPPVRVLLRCPRHIESDLTIHGSWPIALHSIAACRMNLNLHRVPIQGRSMRSSSIPGTDTDIQFTSLFTTGELEDFPAGLTRRYSIAHIDNRHSLPTTASLSSLSLNGSASSITSSITPNGLLLRVDSTVPTDVTTKNG